MSEAASVSSMSMRTTGWYMDAVIADTHDDANTTHFLHPPPRALLTTHFFGVYGKRLQFIETCTKTTKTLMPPGSNIKALLLAHNAVMGICGGGVVSCGTNRCFDAGRRCFYGLRNKIQCPPSPLAFKRTASRGTGLDMGCMAHHVPDCSKCECIPTSICSRDVHEIMRQRFRKAHMGCIGSKHSSGGGVVHFFDA